MPRISIEVETGDNTLVGVSTELISWDSTMTRKTVHRLTGPSANGDKFVYVSQANLVGRDYGINVVLRGAGRSAKVSVTPGTLVDPPASAWPFEVKVKPNRTIGSGTCYFTIGDGQ